jgi:hypothetical protein
MTLLVPKHGIGNRPGRIATRGPDSGPRVHPIRDGLCSPADGGPGSAAYGFGWPGSNVGPPRQGDTMSEH